jgi:hypothetical protein
MKEVSLNYANISRCSSIQIVRNYTTMFPLEMACYLDGSEIHDATLMAVDH